MNANYLIKVALQKRKTIFREALAMRKSYEYTKYLLIASANQSSKKKRPDGHFSAPSTSELPYSLYCRTAKWLSFILELNVGLSLNCSSTQRVCK